MGVTYWVYYAYIVCWFSLLLQFMYGRHYYF